MSNSVGPTRMEILAQALLVGDKAYAWTVLMGMEGKAELGLAIGLVTDVAELALLVPRLMFPGASYAIQRKLFGE